MALKDKLTKCELGVISAGVFCKALGAAAEMTEPECFVSAHCNYYLHNDNKPFYFS